MSNKKEKAAETAAAEARALVPKLRFPEFRDAEKWKIVNLGKISHLVTEKVGRTTCIPYTITSGVGLVSQQEKFGRITAGSSLKNYIALQKNDFAYNKSATKAYPEGFIALCANNDRAAVPSSIFTCFRVDQNQVIPNFLNSLFFFNIHGRWLKSRIAVGARAHGSLQVSDSDLMAMPLPLPSGPRSVSEQQKIADCLASIDELITLESQKLDHLKLYKKGLMQQLFPTEGETVPRLRFPEFRNTGEWLKRKLGSLGSFTGGGTPDKNNFSYWEGMNPWVSSSDISDDSIYEIKISRFISDQAIQETATKIVPENSILLVSRVGVGKIAITRNKICTSQDFTNFTPDEANLVFLAYGLKTMRDKFLSFNQGMAIKGFTKNDVSSLEVPLPVEPREQQKIADCLASIDELITLESQRLDNLKTHKKGLMQQLFPAPDGFLAAQAGNT